MRKSDTYIYIRNMYIYIYIKGKIFKLKNLFDCIKVIVLKSTTYQILSDSGTEPQL